MCDSLGHEKGCGDKRGKMVFTSGKSSYMSSCEMFVRSPNSHTRRKLHTRRRLRKKSSGDIKVRMTRVNSPINNTLIHKDKYDKIITMV